MNKKLSVEKIDEMQVAIIEKATAAADMITDPIAKVNALYQVSKIIESYSWDIDSYLPTKENTTVKEEEKTVEENVSIEEPIKESVEETKQEEIKGSEDTNLELGRVEIEVPKKPEPITVEVVKEAVESSEVEEEIPLPKEKETADETKKRLSIFIKKYGEVGFGEIKDKPEILKLIAPELKKLAIFQILLKNHSSETSVPIDVASFTNRMFEEFQENCGKNLKVSKFLYEFIPYCEQYIMLLKDNSLKDIHKYVDAMGDIHKGKGLSAINHNNIRAVLAISKNGPF